MAQKPEQKFRVGNVTATIWCNEVKKDGETKEIKHVSFEKSYKDKDGEWKNTSSLNIADLPKAMVVLGKAYEYLVLRDLKEEEAVV
ncbi:hypothetical protein KY311_04440 [Candidatus Woesearchaeota archaeon]|nr:hypothetical protein [Candidatus Woesearchaeota archaeon]MBW3017443.1 hypothetical protein [Candidatus Woesearchaeota archaeon]